MNYRLTKRQLAWLEAASAEDRDLFLAAGKADVPSLVNTTSMKPVYRPSVRGVLVSEDAFSSYEEALKFARGVLAEKVTAANGRKLDERALGIDDVYRDFADRLSDSNVKVDWVVPLSACVHGAMPEVLDDWLEDLSDAALERLDPHIPTFVRMYRAKREDDFVESDELCEMMSEAVFSDQAYGVVIRVSQPVPRDRWGNSVSFSWGYTNFTTLYGETYEDACEAAIQWGLETWAKERDALPDRDATKAEREDA